MSRLIVKNLPKQITDEKVRQIFGENGTITDIQLKYTSEGTFRRFGFIGFQTEEEAERAIKSLNNTFVNSSKISVEKCALLGDASKPKSWSKYAPDSSAYKKTHQVEEKVEEKELKKKKKKREEVEILEKYKDDPMFEEFLQVHGEADKLEKLKLESKLQNTDTENDKDSGTHSENEGDKIEEEKLAEKPISDLEYLKMLKEGVKNLDKTVDSSKPKKKSKKKEKAKTQLFTLKLRGLPYTTKKKDIKDFLRPNIPFSIRIPRNIHGIAFVGYKTQDAFKKALLKDRSFIKGKQISVGKYEEKTSEGNKNNNLNKNKWKSQEEALKNEEDIAESGRIFIRNLAYITTEKDVEDLFSKYGPLAEVNLPVDSTTRKMKGFGVVTFMMPEHAAKAYSELDGSVLHGRMLHLLPGKTKDTPITDTEESSTNYKQKKAAKEKSQARSSHNWNALFLGHDAVAEVIADTYGTSKENVVESDGKHSAAVKLALGETQIVAQTRKYLEQQGVVLDVFNTSAPKARSKTIILVKNLPSRTEAREIKEIFEKHGELGRIILPPSGITALVEFLEPSEARKAFTRLAYSKFKNAPLYLEWAPENSLVDVKVNTKKEQKKEEGKEEHNEVTSAEAETQIEEDDAEPEPETTLFVKNLNFRTTDTDLRKHFEGCGKLKYATVTTKKDTNNPGQKLSMGYGFVQFMYKKGADKALKTLQQSVLDGKSLELKRSERTLSNEVKSTRKQTKLTKQTGSKILVRNVPFQANRKEIFELFSTFGEIKALRLPKKMTPGADSHRGFAFVDYVTQTDAKAAFEALSQSTHLYGRRLVLEWATTEEGVDEIRKRTADHFGQAEVVKSKKSVFNIE